MTGEAGATDAGDWTLTARGAPSRERTPPGSGAPSSGDDLPEIPPSLHERFEAFELLGRGGMGAVFRARDFRLRRSVAVKLLLDGAPGSGDGFLHEARAQARILHPNVCEVFEAGTADGVPFIVMRFVEGGTLKTVGPTLAIEDAVRILQRVSLAIHEAHRAGVIHRDVKPGNVLVERGEDGALKPCVADFGIARDVGSGTAATAHGAQGTPPFMAPEQAAGKSLLDRRTDVYGLGATLYDVLTGRPPFSGETVPAILREVQEEPPVAPRSINAAIPRDLEAIVLKCLEKDPDRRYESARALAEDLERFLERDPVLARPGSRASRAWKRARKNKGRLALALLALVAAVAVSGLWIRARRIAAQREDLARELGGDVREVQLFLRGAYLLPLHDVEHERDFIRSRLANIASRAGGLGEIGAGPKDDALGRGYLALQEPETALACFRRAEERGYRAPGFDYVMGLALIEVYRREIEAANRVRDRREKAARLAEIQRRYREPSLLYLRAALTAGVESPSLARGLIALHEGREEEAIADARAAFEAAPWLYEAKKLEGDALYALGSRTRHDKIGFDYEATMDRFHQAARAYRSASEIARSDPSVHEAECELWSQIMNAAQRHGDPIQEPFEAARAACKRAIAASPRSPSGYLRLAFAEQLHAFWVVWRGRPEEQPDRVLDEATREVEAAAARSPDDPFAHYLVGAVWRAGVYRRRLLAQDTSAALDRSIAGYEATLAREPAFLWALSEECEMLSLRGGREALRGVEPGPSFDRARSRCRAALSLDPQLSGLSYNLLLPHVLDVERLVAAGRSPARSIEEALEVAGSLDEQARSEPWVAAFRTEIRWREAEYEIAAGGDAGPPLARAREEAARLPASFPDAEGRAPLAAVTAEALLARLEQGREPRRRVPELEQALARARAGFAEAVAESPEAVPHAIWLARVEVTALRYRMALGEASLSDARAALAPIAGFVTGPRGDPWLFEVAARAREARADLAAQLGADAEADIASGLRLAEQAISAGPGLAAAHAALGRLKIREARATADAARRRELSRSASEALAAAIAHNPLFARSQAGWVEEARRLGEGP